VTANAVCVPSDSLQFLRNWAADPLRIAAIAPSGRALSQLITREVEPAHGPVLELGPGTGVFTRALLERGVGESELTLIETEADFGDLLRQRFPRARVLDLDAARLARARVFAGPVVGAVISGLPLLSMSLRKVMAILTGAFVYLRAGGGFYQFTYGPRCPVPRPLLDRLGLKATRIGGTLRNLPPASVYRIQRRAPGRERTHRLSSPLPPVFNLEHGHD
jgi:phosphatidylethanolamine/phosphatidyl-N-methylethanolamine N-methyltransferase